MDSQKLALLRIGRQVCYALALIGCYLMQTTPGFLAFFGAKPVFLLPLAVCIAAREGVFPGALWGAAAGLLWDLASGRTGGFFAIQLMAVCFAVGALVALYLRGSAFNLLALCTAAALVLTGTDLLFHYLLHGYSGVGALFLRRSLPTLLLTALVSLPLRWVVFRIGDRFDRALDQFSE